MAETDTPTLDRKPDTGQPGPPPGPSEGGGSGGSGFGNLAGAVYGTDAALDEWKRSAATVREGLKAKAEKMEPAIAAAEREVAAPRPEPPGAPTLTKPPSRQLTEFLAPVDGESPVTSITKLLQAIGLFATGASGAAKGDARAGLAAFTGAMVGWQVGDRERADRHFADWEAKTGEALTKWRTERTTYQDIMEAANLSIEQRFKLLQLAAIREDNKAMADVAEKKDLETLLSFLGQRETTAAQLGLARDKIIEHRTEFERIRTETERHNREMAGLARERFQQAFSSRMEPTGIDFLAEQYLAYGRLPAMGAGMAGTRAEIFKRADELSRERGQGPQDVVARQQLLRGVQNALNTNLRMKAQIGSFIKTADANIELAGRVSEEQDRTGTPLFNKWFQAGQRAVAGDPGITKFDTINASVAAEFARVMESATAGGTSTVEGRRHALSLLNTAQTKEQYKANLAIIHEEMHNRVSAFEKETTDLQDMAKRGGPAAKMPDAPPLTKSVPPGAKIEGNDIVSESGKYIWKDGKWQSR